MDGEKLAENAGVVISEIKRKKPADAKGDFLRSISLASTMSPGVWVKVEGV
jgi:large subunit ribosomal protein L1